MLPVYHIRSLPSNLDIYYFILFPNHYHGQNDNIVRIPLLSVLCKLCLSVKNPENQQADLRPGVDFRRNNSLDKSFIKIL